MLNIIFPIFCTYLSTHLILISYCIFTGKNYKFSFIYECFSLIISLLAYSNYFIRFLPLKWIFSILTFNLSIYFYERKGIKEILRISMILWGSGMLIDMFISLMFIFTNTKITSNIIVTSFYTLILHFILLFLSCLFASKTKYNEKNLRNFIDIIKLKYRAIILLVLTICSLSVLNLSNLNSIVGEISLLIIILFLSYLSLNLLNLKKEEYQMSVFSKQLIKKNNDYCDEIIKLKQIKHNINHNLLLLKSKSTTQDNKKLLSKISKKFNYNSEKNLINNIPTSLEYIICYNLFNDKYDINKFNIKVDNTLKGDPFNKLNDETLLELTEALGIIIDNAKEASYNSKEKIILLEFTNNNNHLLIKIKNTHNNSLDLDSVFNAMYSTKKIKSGYGLNSLLKYKHITISAKIINNIFEISLYLKNINI